jgi:hypothetical protein
MDEQQTEAFLDGEDSQDYQDQLEAQDDEVVNQYKEGWDPAQVPTAKKQDNLFSLFQKVWKTGDSSKVANLNSGELGRLDFSVRDAQYLALLGLMLKHRNFATFFRTSSEIILSTSASKKGWFTELFVSQKKYTQRAASVATSAPQGQAGSQNKKWSIFGGQSTNQGNSQSETS